MGVVHSDKYVTQRGENDSGEWMRTEVGREEWAAEGRDTEMEKERCQDVLSE